APGGRYPIKTNLARGMLAGDLDGDGNSDLAAVGDAGGQVASVLRNNWNGTFTAPTRFPTGLGRNYTFGAASADLNRDGLPDIIAADPTGDHVISVLINQSPNPPRTQHPEYFGRI